MISCQLYFDLIREPWTYIVLMIFAILAILASIGNTIALVILCKPSMRSSKSNRMVMSMVLSDLLVGYVLLPFCIYQISGESRVQDCTIETIRIYISVSTLGTSSMNVGLIAIDRYLLTVNLTNYRQQRSNKKLTCLIFVTWVVPFACLSLRHFNKYAFLLLLAFIIFGSMAALIIFYVLLIRTVKKNAINIAAYKGADYESKKEGKHMAARKKVLKNSKLAKSTLILTTCFIICLIPTALMLIITMFYRGVTPIFLEYLIIVSLLFAAANSSINPVIYASKFPKFRYNLKLLFHKRNWSICDNVLHKWQLLELDEIKLIHCLLSNICTILFWKIALCP